MTTPKTPPASPEAHGGASGDGRRQPNGTANLKNCLEISNGLLREAIISLEEMIHAAVTGDGLKEIRANPEYQRMAWQVALRKNRKPVLVMGQPNLTAMSRRVE